MSSYDFEIIKLLDTDRSIKLPINYFKELTEEDKGQLARDYSIIKPRIPRYVWVESEDWGLLAARKIKDVDLEKKRIDSTYPDGIERLALSKKIYIENDKEEIENLINVCFISLDPNKEVPEICDFVAFM